MENFATVPNPILNVCEIVEAQASTTNLVPTLTHIIPLIKYLRFGFMIGVLAAVLRFCCKLKDKTFSKNGLSGLQGRTNFGSKALNLVIRIVRKNYFPEIIEYFSVKSKISKNIQGIGVEI